MSTIQQMAILVLWLPLQCTCVVGWVVPFTFCVHTHSRCCILTRKQHCLYYTRGSYVYLMLLSTTCVIQSQHYACVHAYYMKLHALNMLCTLYEVIVLCCLSSFDFRAEYWSLPKASPSQKAMKTNCIA